MADTGDLKSPDRKVVSVRLAPAAPRVSQKPMLTSRVRCALDFRGV